MKNQKGLGMFLLKAESYRNFELLYKGSLTTREATVSPPPHLLTHTHSVYKYISLTNSLYYN